MSWEWKQSEGLPAGYGGLLWKGGTMYQKPPKPDALLTLVSQLQILHDEWGRAADASGNSDFPRGQADAWRNAQRQIGALIESAKAARKRGIYLTDAQEQLLAHIEQRHKDTLHFLQHLQRRILDSLKPIQLPEEPTDGATAEADTPL
jgi:hypothetical protein